jgi:hypothetical protein
MLTSIYNLCYSYTYISEIFLALYTKYCGVLKMGPKSIPLDFSEIVSFSTSLDLSTDLGKMSHLAT